MKFYWLLAAVTAVRVSYYDADGNYVYRKKSFETDDEAQALRDTERAQKREDKKAMLEAAKQRRAEARQAKKELRDAYKEELSNLTTREEKRALMIKYRDQ